jgi:hypothetical protein
MKQTSTEWLFEKLWDEPKDKLTWYAILQQAKEMERQQHSDTWEDGMLSDNGFFGSFEQYYTETFKNK